MPAMNTQYGGLPPSTIGAMIGHAIARDVKAEGMPREWTGLSPEDGDRIVAAGIQPDSAEWAEAEQAAKVAYLSHFPTQEG